MNNNLKKFGENLKNYRLKNNLSLREVCKLVDYDPSNWSKIEHGKNPPPSDEKVLSKWALALGIKSGSEEFQNFIDQAKITQGIIPDDILSQSDVAKLMPAFFRTLRNKKPTKEEMDNLIKLIKSY
jgi:transcriptional regulator with XRE-family HTH domain